MAWGCIGRFLRQLERLFGCSWRRFGRLGEVLGASWVELGASWKGFGGSWRRFGAIVGCLGRLLRDSWEVLEASRHHLGSIFEWLNENREIVKILIFLRESWYFEGWGFQQSPKNREKIEVGIKYCKKIQKIWFGRPKTTNKCDFGGEQTNFGAKMVAGPAKDFLRC